jgi:hypothetical protein
VPDNNWNTLIILDVVIPAAGTDAIAPFTAVTAGAVPDGVLNVFVVIVISGAKLRLTVELLNNVTSILAKVPDLYSAGGASLDKISDAM